MIVKNSFNRRLELMGYDNNFVNGFWFYQSLTFFSCGIHPIMLSLLLNYD